MTVESTEPLPDPDEQSAAATYPDFESPWKEAITLEASSRQIQRWIKRILTAEQPERLYEKSVAWMQAVRPSQGFPGFRYAPSGLHSWDHA